MQGALPAHAPEEHPREPRLLVVEDVDETRVRIRALLQSDGYVVDEAANGAEALRKVTGADYDAVLLDLALPHVDGWQFREAQLRDPAARGIPTIIVTGLQLTASARYALKTEHYIFKPFADTSLLEAVGRACARARRRDEDAGPARNPVWALGYLEGRTKAFERGNVSLRNVAGAARLAARHGVLRNDISLTMARVGLMWDPVSGDVVPFHVKSGE